MSNDWSDEEWAEAQAAQDAYDLEARKHWWGRMDDRVPALVMIICLVLLAWWIGE